LGKKPLLNTSIADQVIAKRLVTAAKEFDHHYRDFDQFDKGLERNKGRALMDEWDGMIHAWERDHGKDCPYEEQSKGTSIFLSFLLVFF
jgi:hypothetical protein